MRDPPDLDEAITAAQCLTDCLGDLVQIAANLIGLPEQDVRAALLARKPESVAKPSASLLSANQRGVTVETRRRKTINRPARP